jgi:hypothetical protein
MSTLYSLIRIPLKQHLHNRYQYHWYLCPNEKRIDLVGWTPVLCVHRLYSPAFLPSVIPWFQGRISTSFPKIDSILMATSGRHEGQRKSYQHCQEQLILYWRIYSQFTYICVIFFFLREPYIPVRDWRWVHLLQRPQGHHHKRKMRTRRGTN